MCSALADVRFVPIADIKPKQKDRLGQSMLHPPMADGEGDDDSGVCPGYACRARKGERADVPSCPCNAFRHRACGRDLGRAPQTIPLVSAARAQTAADPPAAFTGPLTEVPTVKS